MLRWRGVLERPGYRSLRTPRHATAGDAVSFEFEKKVRFGEIDQAGIVYYPRFFNFYHLTLEEFFESVVGTSYAEVIKGWKIGFPTVHVDADFTVPLKFGDVTRISLAIVKLGTASVRTRYQVRRQDGVLCAEAQLTTVCVDMDTFRARPIPERLREILMRYHEDGDNHDGHPVEV
jgi:4-hydroxybenzoyl-CoA thioesterase